LCEAKLEPFFHPENVLAILIYMGLLLFLQVEGGVNINSGNLAPSLSFSRPFFPLIGVLLCAHSSGGKRTTTTFLARALEKWVSSDYQVHGRPEHSSRPRSARRRPPSSRENARSRRGTSTFCARSLERRARLRPFCRRRLKEPLFFRCFAGDWLIRERTSRNAEEAGEKKRLS